MAGSGVAYRVWECFRSGYCAYPRTQSGIRVLYNLLDGTIENQCMTFVKRDLRAWDLDARDLDARGATCTLSSQSTLDATSSVGIDKTGSATMSLLAHTTSRPKSSTTLSTAVATTTPSSTPSPSITSEGSIAVWSWTDDGCDVGIAESCNQTFYVYAVEQGKDPSDVCDGWIAAHAYDDFNVIDFDLPQLSGGETDFAWNHIGGVSTLPSPGYITGSGIPDSLSAYCTSLDEKSQTCKFTHKNGAKLVKRLGGAEPPESIIAYTANAWSACSWGESPGN